jgi:hypothetical protein
MDQELNEELTATPGAPLQRFWRATILCREKEYGDWEKKVFFWVVTQSNLLGSPS